MRGAAGSGLLLASSPPPPAPTGVPGLPELLHLALPSSGLESKGGTRRTPVSPGRVPGSPFRESGQQNLTDVGEASPESCPSTQWSPEGCTTGRLCAPSWLAVGEGPRWGVLEGRGQHFDSREGSQLSISCSALSVEWGREVE